MKQDVATPIKFDGGNSCGVCLGLDRAISYIKHLSQENHAQTWDFKKELKETPGCV